MAKMPEKHPTPFQSDDRWAAPDEVAFYMLWFEFLTVSPSYELARRHRSQTMTDTEQARLPLDFARVLSVYDDLGDVQRLDFEEWWLAKALRFFGYQGEKPRVGPIDVLVRDNPDQLGTLMTRASSYISGRWHRQGEQPSAILAIPLGLSKAQISQQIEYLLSLYDDDLKQRSFEPAKYKLAGRKRDTKSLFRYLKCLTIKAYFRELKLFEIGALAELSSTYSSRFEGDGDVEDRHALKILTSRAINRGMMIAENAARGVFPTYTKNEHAVAADWTEMGALLESRQDWLDAP